MRILYPSYDLYILVDMIVYVCQTLRRIEWIFAVCSFSRCEHFHETQAQRIVKLCLRDGQPHR